MSALFAVSRTALAARSLTFSRYSKLPCLQLARLYSSGKFPAHTVIGMPALSPTMTQGNIISWAKKEGDELQPGEPIAEIETDKASMDFEFQEEGYLAKILMEGGAQEVPVGKPIAVYVEDADSLDAFKDFTAADAGDGEAGVSKEEPAKEEPAKEEPKTSQDSAKSESPAPSPAPSSSSAPVNRVFASPLAKTIALDKGIALKNIKGSGPGGRILAKDLEKATPATATPSGPAAASIPTYEDVPLSNMRKTIAKRLTQSTQENPSYIVQSELSVSKLLKLRQSLNATSEDRYRLSINDLLIKAIALASLRVPQVNSAWLGDQGVIREYKKVDVSVAVATPTGLITPIVKDADTKGLATISKQVKALGKKAKDGKLAPEEYQGGTITISNLGMNHAVNSFTSIINPPQSAIVAIGTTTKKAVPSSVNEQGFVFDDVITVTGTFDHRVVDGALGGEWIKALKQIVENPLEMLV